MQQHLKLKRRFGSYMLFAIVVLIGKGAFAQIPAYGIYRLSNSTDNIFPAEHYAEYIFNPGRFYEVNLAADQEIVRYNLPYALVSVDTLSGILKIALLRDTVSKRGQEKLHSLYTGIYYNNDWQPTFAQEFKIEADTVSGAQPLDDWFPVKPDINGQWFFGKYLSNYGDLLAFVQLPPERQQLQRYDSITTIYEQGSRFTFGESFFTPFSGHPAYRDLIFTYDHDSIPIYKAALSQTRPFSYFRNGSYIAVRIDSADWLAVDRVVVVSDSQRYYLPGYGTVKVNTKLNILSGWVRKEDLVTDPWIRQQQQTKYFRFEVAGSYNEENDPVYRGEVEAIKIINKKTREVQVISNIGVPLADSLTDVVQVKDCNFDGWPDIMIYSHDGGAGPNDGYNFYLYNSSSGRFEYNETLSNLTQVEVDIKSNTITSAWRAGAAHHGGEQYTFMHDTLTKISYWDDYWGSGYFGLYSDGTLLNGRWQDSSYYEGNITVKSINVFRNPNEQQKPVGRLFLNDYVDIHGGTPLWIYVVATNGSGNPIKGWIRKTALLPQRWLDFTAQTNQYRFSAATSDSSSVAAIQVTKKATGRVIQIIPVYQSTAFDDSLFQVGDYNADGLPDFRMETDQTIYDYYLFDKKEQIFKIDTTIAATNK